MLQEFNTPYITCSFGTLPNFFGYVLNQPQMTTLTFEESISIRSIRSFEPTFYTHPASARVTYAVLNSLIAVQMLCKCYVLRFVLAMPCVCCVCVCVVWVSKVYCVAAKGRKSAAAEGLPYVYLHRDHLSFRGSQYHNIIDPNLWRLE